ncbi:DNA-binding IclR family transcriptional regulator [Labrenzia sp. EL_13]|nr:DNA-binding IclR family transcriptional regulator [Labrenzia sp. EL_195]MBG6202105.1 DNA-binding IclR family transcriptional regulator [Labrenzia sp. EL_13]
MSEQRTKLQKYSAPALEKGLDILEFLSLTDTSPSLSQLAQGIGRSKNEIFRMMIVLEERGYIQRNGDDHFSLTDRLSTLGADRSVASKLAELATPYLANISEETGLSNHLSVLKEGALLVVTSFTATQSYGLSVQAGYQMPFMETSAGLCFMSDFNTREDLQFALEGTGEKVGEIALQRLFEDAKSCRKKGYSIAPNLSSDSISELSASVRHGTTKRTVATITIPFITTDEMTNRLATIAAKLALSANSLGEKIAITLPAVGSNELHV